MTEPVDHKPFPLAEELRKKRKPRYATVRHPAIEAAVKALYRFEREEQARARLKSIADSFILSRKHMPQGAEEVTHKPLKEIILWVRGFQLREEDEAKGALGHFAKIAIKELKDGRYTLKAEKLPVEIRNHPQKRRTPSKHPNWGHPVLRSVLKGKLYPSVEEAAAALQMLHEEYPEVSIPTGNKLYIITYGKPEAGSKPVQKVVLEIKLQPDGSCRIATQENKKPFQPKDSQPKIAEGGARSKIELAGTGETQPEAKQKGYYTGMVELRRRKKRRTAPPRPPKPAEE